MTLVTCRFCLYQSFSNVFTYYSPPNGEIKFGFNTNKEYYRQIFRCDSCGHFVSVCEMEMGELYSGDYVSSNYQDAKGIKRNFDRIISLPPSESDNANRVEGVLNFAKKQFTSSTLSKPPSLLDVGSGLAVFPYKMKEKGWNCTTLDPDIRSVEHARKVVGAKSIHADFIKVEDLGKFDMISFNKVLEHVEDPVKMLAKSLNYIEETGFVYVEVPDGEFAMIEGKEREEFFIDHHHIFSVASLSLLASRSGYNAKIIERLREPSRKFTLRAYLLPNSCH